MFCVKLSMFFMFSVKLSMFYMFCYYNGTFMKDIALVCPATPYVLFKIILSHGICLYSRYRDLYIQHAILLIGFKCNTTSIHGHTMGIQCTNHSQSVRVQLCAI